MKGARGVFTIYTHTCAYIILIIEFIDNKSVNFFIKPTLEFGKLDNFLQILE